jgi:hypothetical protein
MEDPARSNSTGAVHRLLSSPTVIPLSGVKARNVVGVLIVALPVVDFWFLVGLMNRWYARSVVVPSSRETTAGGPRGAWLAHRIGSPP